MMNVTGTLQKIGNKYTEEVLVFLPNEPINIVETKILKKGT